MRVKKDKFKEMVELINTPEKKVKKMDYKQKQKYYNARSKIGRVFHDSKRLGTYEGRMKRG